jgi:enamine deaminase RidA (YjgF/YER057c/UK114 family)
VSWLAGLLLLLFTVNAQAQRGGGGFGGGYGGYGGMGGGRAPTQLAPEVPGPEVDGPPDSALAVVLFDLKGENATRYNALRDSFMVATKPLRDSAVENRTRMYAKLDAGDHEGAIYQLEILTKQAKVLKEQQGKFEDRLSKVLSSDEMKQYKKWKKDQEQEVEDRRQRDIRRWREGGGGRGARGGEEGTAGAAMGGERFSGGYDRPLDPKTAVETPGLKAALGSSVIRVGREVYVAGQMAVNDSGALIGGSDLAAQARQAFTNLTAALTAAKSGPLDVVRLTIYVVNYDPKAVDIIRSAAATYLASRNPPAITVVGVQSLTVPGALISVDAMSLANIGR